MQAGVGVVVTDHAQDPPGTDAITGGDSRPEDGKVSGPPLTAGHGHHGATGDHAREGDASGAGRPDRLTGSRAQVDTAMGAGGVGVVTAIERANKATADRVAPVGLRSHRRRRSHRHGERGGQAGAQDGGKG